ncbi:MAG: hypothetical protein KKC37_05470, partial [Proteobacteria bacterium]|nr:hypothetical protein [Pseudomonadota bacterium]
WQVRKFEEMGQRAIIFFDEPFLTGFGSAFTTLDRGEVIRVLSETFAAVRQHVEVKIGVHCCGNTDWSMLVETGLDIVNLDSHGFGQSLLLYPEALSDLYARGGLVAWGAIPTLNYTGEETAAGLWTMLKEHLSRLADSGPKQEVVARNSVLTPACSVITPACGMASCSAPAAGHIHRLCAEVAELAKAWN